MERKITAPQITDTGPLASGKVGAAEVEKETFLGKIESREKHFPVLICCSYVEKVTVPSEYSHYEDIPTPNDYPVFGKGLVPRKQAQDLQAQRAKQRYQPFG